MSINNVYRILGVFFLAGIFFQGAMASEEPKKYRLGHVAAHTKNTLLEQGYRPFSFFLEKRVSCEPRLREKVVVKDGDIYRFGCIHSFDAEQKSAAIALGWGNKPEYKDTYLDRINVGWEDQEQLFSCREWDERDAHCVFSHVSFSDWCAACMQQKQNNCSYTTVLDKKYFKFMLKAFVKEVKGRAPSWIFEKKEAPHTDYFHVQKHIAQSETRAIVFGDVHGDIEPLLNGLNVLAKKKLLRNDFSLSPNMQLIFLGDYVDRGRFGVEVWQTLFMLAVKNPGQVIILRGNHEDVAINSIKIEGSLNFDTELKNRLGLNDKERLDFYDMYNVLPVGLYLQLPAGSKKLTFLLCHGMPDIGFSAKDFIESEALYSVIDRLERSAVLERQPHDVLVDADSGYNEQEKKELATLFNSKLSDLVELRQPDILKGQGLPEIGFCKHDVTSKCDGLALYIPRGFRLGSKLVEGLLERDGINLIIRGHQHNSIAPDNMLFHLQKGYGCYAHSNSVVTLMSGGLASIRRPFSYSFIMLYRIQNSWDIQHIYDKEK